ncbi:MAG: D-3-phosphoglycerate dehydrogenase [Chloroflexi bacterium ADurb.Bin325]|nr:MAG: D-3-phosphoglycerate dehydrogenase [Chloroflexi bacterium ADurb.Bin325]
MSTYRTVFVTERGLVHQQAALRDAPPELAVVMLRQPARAELLAQLADADFLISERMGVIDAELLAAAPRLKLIVRLGSLAYDIDRAAAEARGVRVVVWPQPGVIRVAEHIVLQMLALTKRLREVEAIALAAEDWGPSRRTDEDTFAYNWSGRQGLGGLADQAVGILGFGEIGAELARRLRGWECCVSYHRRRRLPAEVEAELGVTYATRDATLAGSDFVVNLLPYFPETDLTLGAAAFGQMRRGAFLVSCGSGSVIDEATLAEAVRSGQLGGAALDTYEWEPLRADNPLRRLAVEEPRANVLLTPHIAAGAARAGERSSRRRDYEPIMRYLQSMSDG